MTVIEAFEINVKIVSDTVVTATMPIKEIHTQQYGYLHGGVSIVLAETLAGIGSTQIIDLTKYVAAGVKVESEHIKAKKIGGYVRATATLIERDEKKHTWRIVIVDENHHRINQSIVVCRIVNCAVFA